MKIVELRSDVYTLPTKEMLDAIQTAQLGNEVKREDPTTKELDELAAKKMGKEDACLVPSGSMANTVSILSQTERGNEVIVEERSHTVCHEYCAWSILGGLIPIYITGKMGYMDPYDIEGAIKGGLPIEQKTGLICVENTHNKAGGIAITPEQMKAIWDVAKDHELPLYIDGSRIFNAAVYLGIDVKKLTRYSDSVMFCLSKSLSAPIGSMVCGTEEFIAKVRRYRKLCGGNMRQTGIIAAPGIIAITNMVDRLKEDHENVEILAEGLKEINGIKLLHPVQTNILWFDVGGLGLTGNQFRDKMLKFGVKTGGSPRTRLIGPRSTLRVVVHRGISKEDIKYTIECVEKIAAK